MKKQMHIGVVIDCDMQAVYDFASDPANLPQWASGVSRSIEQVGGEWIAQSPMGRITFAFAPRNTEGVLDHDVTLEDGRVFRNPMRVYPCGAACAVVFTLNAAPDMSEDTFKDDAATIQGDLYALKNILEKQKEENGG